jgi:hypothetical protein
LRKRNERGIKNKSSVLGMWDVEEVIEMRALIKNVGIFLIHEGLKKTLELCKFKQLQGKQNK